MNTQSKDSLLTFDRRAAGIGAATGIGIFLICCLFYSWKDGLVLAVLFPAAGAVCLRPRQELTRFLLSALWALVCLMLTCALPTAMVSTESYFAIGGYRLVLNFLCAAIVCGVFLVLTGRIRSAAALGTGALLLLSTASAFLFHFRGNLLKPMDFLAIRTALNVAGQYSFSLPRPIAMSWFIWLLAIFILYRLPEGQLPLKPLWIRLGAAGLTLLSVGACLYGARNIRPNNWSNEGATRNGYLLNFAVNFRDSFPEKPEGYSSQALEALDSAYFSKQPEVPERQPNILVIMNESFSDFSILGGPLQTNQPVTPFWDSLHDDTIRGYALASVFGDGTANSEFEFLTGLSMSNLPEGACPYQQYIHSPLPSLPSYLKSLGYQTQATHPYFSSGWNRTQVYPLLGFDAMTFDESYPYKDLVRDFVSDREFYRYLLEALENAGEEPLFLFGISMQNHGDYNYPESDTYRQTISLTDAPGAYPMAEQYLSLLHESDRALEELLSQLEQFPEDTVVLFFGDHFPQVEGDFFHHLHGGPFVTPEEQALQFTVPFFLWANFDIPEQKVALTSLNYLGRYLLDAAGLPLSGQYQFLRDLESAIPALNTSGYASRSQNAFLSPEDAPEAEAHWLRQYAILQHSILFDPAHSPVS